MKRVDSHRWLSRIPLTPSSKATIITPKETATSAIRTATTKAGILRLPEA